MPFCTTSIASARVKPTSACFAATYAVTYGYPRKPAMLETLTIRPYPRASIPGSTAREQRNAERRLTDSMRSSTASLVFRKGALSAAPALLTRMSTGASPSNSEKICSTCAASVTSQIALCEYGMRSFCSLRAFASRPINTAIAPACARRAAIAAPMPREAPVTMARRPENTSARTGEIPEQLVAPRPILLWPGNIIIALLRGGMQRPIRIDKVRPRKAAKIGAARSANAVHVIDLVDVADGHGGNTRFIANEVGERRLEHAAVHGLGVYRSLPRRDIDDIGAGMGKGPCNHERLGFAVSGVAQPIGGRNAHRHRLLVRPRAPHRGEPRQRKPQTVFDLSTVGVGTPVHRRRKEGGKQITVCGVQLDHVEAASGSATRRGNEIRDDSLHVVFVHCARYLVLGRPRNRRWRNQLPVAGIERFVLTFPRHLGRALWPRMPELQRNLRVAMPVHEIDNARPGPLMGVVVQSSTARRDARVG